MRQITSSRSAIASDMLRFRARPLASMQQMPDPRQPSGRRTNTAMQRRKYEPMVEHRVRSALDTRAGVPTAIHCGYKPDGRPLVVVQSMEHRHRCGSPTARHSIGPAKVPIALAADPDECWRSVRGQLSEISTGDVHAPPAHNRCVGSARPKVVSVRVPVLIT